MKITAQQFISNNREKGTFVTILKHYSENSTKKTEKEGDIYCLLSLFGNTSLPAERVSKFVWDGILDGYIYSMSKSTNESLKDGITEGVKKLKSLMKNDKSLEDLGINVNFVLVVQRKEGLYIGNLGENEVFVFKEGKFINITEILGKSKASTAGVALQEGDILIASTMGVISRTLAELEQHSKPELVINELREIGKTLQGNQGLVFFAYEDENQTQIKPIQTIKPLISASKEEPIKANKEINVVEDKGVSSNKPGIQLPIINPDLGWINKYWAKIKPTLKAIKDAIVRGVIRIIVGIKSFTSKLSVKFKELYGNKKWFKKAASQLSTVKINRPNFSGKGMRIDGYKTRDVRAKRIRLVLLVVTVIVILALGINFTIKTRRASIVHNEATKIFTSVETLVKKAENSSTSDKESSELAIFQAKNALKELPEEISEKDTALRQGFDTRILTIEDSLYKRIGLTDSDGKLSTFIDTRLSLGENSNPTDIEIYSDDSGNEYLMVTDKGLNSVFRVSLYDKTSQRLIDTEGLLKDPEYVSMGNSGVFVFDNKTGVLKASYDKDKWFGSFVALSGLARENIKAKNISEFIILAESDNVYLLDQDDDSVLKSVFSYENRYGLYYKYITNEKFANATDILADLSVYVLTKDAPQLIRYSYDYNEQKQNENPLTISGVDGDLGELTKGFTRSSLDDGLFVFDQTLKRFIMFEKPQEAGEDILHPNEVVLKKQYVYRGSKGEVWGSVKDFVVDSSNSTMYILDGSVIWKVML
ncbi:hypothetical protein KKA50_02200 [Patescibacteria group bacterium]|nr:hypothetical protein [Patescibacteria group bacterium]